MARKSLTIVIIALFLFCNISFTTLSYENNNPLGKIFYVGGPSHCSRIQDAIDNASDGDTVFVYRGHYYENLFINKSIRLIGEDRNKTIIDGNFKENVVKIVTDNVYVSGFLIQHCGDNDNAGIYIDADDCSIIRNNISNNDWGCFFRTTASFHNISYNYFFSNGLGVYFSNTDNSIIYRNNFIKSGTGVNFCGSGTNNIVNKNMFFKSSIFIFQSNGNIITNNNFTASGITVEISYKNILENNYANGKPIVYLEEESNLSIDCPAGEIILVNCNNITVKNQNISNVGDCIQLTKCSSCKIINNNLSYASHALHMSFSSFNEIQGNIMVDVTYGIYMKSSNNYNLICNNYCSNSWWAINLGGSRNEIKMNNISNSNYAIRLMTSAYNDIQGNNLIENGCGVHFKDSYSNYNIVRENYIYGGGTGVGSGGSKFNVIENNVFQKNWDGISGQCRSFIIKNNSISTRGDGIALSASYNNVMNNNSVSSDYYGLKLENTHNNTISNSNISNSKYGVYLSKSYENTLSFNKISFNKKIGIAITSDSYNNSIIFNVIDNNTVDASDKGKNYWDDGEKGNYWGDYEIKYPDAKKEYLKGIWDTPYEIPGGNNSDRYPLINPPFSADLYIEVEGGLGLTFSVYSVGDIGAENVNFSYNVSGGFLGLIKYQGFEEYNYTLQVDYKISYDIPVFGIGTIDIKVDAVANNAVSFSKEVQGLVIGPFVFV